MADPIDDDEENLEAARRQSIEQRTANGEGAEDGEQEALPGAAPLKGDKQLTLAGLGPRTMPIESEVSVMSAAVPSKGLLDPEKRGRLVISYAPAKYEYVPIREDGVTKRWKLRQQVRPAHVQSLDDFMAEFVGELKARGVEESVLLETAKALGFAEEVTPALAAVA